MAALLVATNNTSALRLLSTAGGAGVAGGTVTAAALAGFDFASTGSAGALAGFGFASTRLALAGFHFGSDALATNFEAASSGGVRA